MADRRQTVNPDGSIVVHWRGSLDLRVSLRDASGAAILVSGRTYVFEIAGLLRVPVLHLSTTQLQVLLTRAQVRLIGRTPREYALIDETGEPVVVLDGTISVRGYRDEP